VLLAIFTALVCLGLASPVDAHASPPAEDASETHSAIEGPAVQRVSVDLTVWRAGDELPSGPKVSVRGALVDGVAHYRLVAPAKAGDRVVLLNFANAMNEEPLQLDEVALAGYVAGPFDHGGLDVLGAQADVAGLELDRKGERPDLVVTLPEGAREFTLKYRVDVPHRYWPFGCVRKRCSLSGALAPLPSEPAQGGRYLPEGGRVVAPSEWDVSASFGSSRRTGRDEIVIGDGLVEPGRPTSYPSVFWGPNWTRFIKTYHGVEVEVLTHRPRPADKHPDEVRGQLRRDDAGRLFAIAQEAIDVAEFIGAPLQVDSKLLMVQGPLRSNIAEMHPGTVVISDQFVELFGGKRLTKFHETVAARAVFDAFARSWFVGLHDPSTDFWLPGSVSFALTQLWQQRREHRDEYARDLLRNLTFVPAVDRFLYTGQASFSSAYFRGGEDQLRVRNHPLTFGHRLPTGRRIHEKLADLMSVEKLATFYASMLEHRDGSPTKVAERAYGHTLDWFFDQWLGTYPAVDYAIAGVESKRTSSGYRHVITIARDADRELVEPVQVLVTERGGKMHYLQWNGEAGEGDVIENEGKLVKHRFEVGTLRSLKNVRLDPRVRFAESSRYKKYRWQRGDNNDPRFNNRHPHKGRFLYAGAGGSLAVSEFLNATTPVARINAISFFAVFEASQQRDARRTGTIRISKGRESIFSAGGSAGLYFGRLRNRQRRRVRLTPSASGAWLSAGSLDPFGGMRLSQALTLSDTTTRFVWWPELGHRLWAAVGANQTLRLDRDRRDDRFGMYVGAGWEQLWRLAKDHVIATRLEADVTIPIASDPEYRSLQRAGGIGGLNGFLADEIFGMAVALAQGEYRHVYVNDLHLNFVNLSWMRSLGGVFFGGAASVSGCEGYDGWFESGSYYGQLGYGLMAYMQVLGVTPQLIRVDAAVPIGRKQTQCLGNDFPDYLGVAQGLPPDAARRLLPPLNINLTFNHPF
jgi:hypothetical protein